MKNIQQAFLLLFISTLWIEFTYTSQTDDRCQRKFTPKKDSHGFLRRPRRHSAKIKPQLKNTDKDQKIIKEVNILNSQLIEKEFRPDFKDQPAYEKWLAQQQRSLAEINKELQQMESYPNFNNQESYKILLNQKKIIEASLEVAYGHAIKPAQSQNHNSTSKIHRRPVPDWIDYLGIVQLDPKAWKEYTDWAEYYIKTFGFPPPLYLEVIQLYLINIFQIKPSTGFFIQDRTLNHILYSLGSSDSPLSNSSKLLDILKNLKGDDLWIEGGTGHGYIIRDTLELLFKDHPIEDQPEIIGITLNFLSNITHFPNPEKQQIWSGRLLHDIPLSDFEGKKAKLITDFHGIFSYSNHPDQTINTYLQLLDKDGTIVLVYNKDIHIVIKTKKKDLTLTEWLASEVPSLKIETGVGKIKEKSKNETVRYMIIRNPSGEAVNLPEMTLGLRLYNNTSWDMSRILRPIKN